MYFFIKAEGIVNKNRYCRQKSLVEASIQRADVLFLKMEAETGCGGVRSGARFH